MTDGKRTSRESLSLSGEEALNFLTRETTRENEEFETIKEQALASGKEPFDIDLFDSLYTHPDFKYERRVARDKRIRNWEEQYFTRRGRDVRTLREFANVMRDHDDHDWT